MRHLISTTRQLFAAMLLMTCATWALTSCHEENDDYYTTVRVTIVMPEGTAVSQMQGTVKLTNLNNRQSYSSSDFSGTTVTMPKVLRGAYSADVEGSLRYTDAQGTVHTGNFRAATPHCEVLAHPAEVPLDIILL